MHKVGVGKGLEVRRVRLSVAFSVTPWGLADLASGLGGQGLDVDRSWTCVESVEWAESYAFCGCVHFSPSQIGATCVRATEYSFLLEACAEFVRALRFVYALNSVQQRSYHDRDRDDPPSPHIPCLSAW